MTRPPAAPLLLGLAGLLPFAFGVLTLWLPGLADWTSRSLSPRLVAPFVLLDYGQVILAFMSGVLWGFATKAEGQVAATGYALSTLPALWAFFMTGGGPVAAAVNLIVGFVALLALDFMFWRQGLAPRWWMTLRLILTAGVVLCLSVLVL